ncbi:hypothetical protein [Streptomyces sp. ADI96-02]|nr:hypothetical protein [Streptomyces sp. ADI96-02]
MNVNTRASEASWGEPSDPKVQYAALTPCGGTSNLASETIHA